MFSDKLKILRKRSGLTQEQLAATIGVERSSIGKYEGKSKVIPSNDVLKSIADYFNVTMDYLLDREAPKTIRLDSLKVATRIPVVGHVIAGIPIEAIEEVLDWEEIPPEWVKSGHEYFGLVVKGDSMSPHFLVGDVLIIRKQNDCENGELSIVAVNGSEATFKKVIKNKNGIVLQSLNHNYDPMIFTNADIESLPIRIIGVLVELRRKY